MTVLVFGAGTDYALLIIARYREELRRHEDRHEAMAVALRGPSRRSCASRRPCDRRCCACWPPSCTATRGLGPVAAIGVVAALRDDDAAAGDAGALRPLGVLAVRAALRRAPRAMSRRGPRLGPGSRRWSAAAHGTVWLATAAVLAALRLGVPTSARACPATRLYTNEVGSITGQQLIERHYPGGTSSPAVVLAAAATAGPVWPPRRTASTGSRTSAATGRSADGRWVRIDATLADPPAPARPGRRSTRLRDGRAGGARRGRRWSAATGRARGRRTRARSRDNAVVIPLILGVVLVVLILLLRAIVAPLVLLAERRAVLRGGDGRGRASSSTRSGTRDCAARCRCRHSCSWWPWASTTRSS